MIGSQGPCGRQNFDINATQRSSATQPTFRLRSRTNSCNSFPVPPPKGCPAHLSIPEFEHRFAAKVLFLGFSATSTTPRPDSISRRPCRLSTSYATSSYSETTIRSFGAIGIRNIQQNVVMPESPSGGTVRQQSPPAWLVRDELATASLTRLRASGSSGGRITPSASMRALRRTPRACLTSRSGNAASPARRRRSGRAACSKWS